MSQKETKKKPVEKINFNSLPEFAAYELHRAGLTNNEDEDARKVAECTMAFIKRFEKQKHNPTTGRGTIQLFNKLINAEPLSPITDDPDEWERFETRTEREDSDESRTEVFWQNRRVRRYISEDGGKTYIDQRDGKKYESEAAKKAEEESEDTTTTEDTTPAEEKAE